MRQAESLGIPCHVLDFGRVNSIHRPFRIGDGLAAGRDLVRAARQLNRIGRAQQAQIVHSNGLKAHAIAVAARRLG
ncbi:hypothetical protein J8J40_28565, partial [Mycobacterium tuberculosis]|nr:hypothetical protein [Mycobacterium tuberculosis]